MIIKITLLYDSVCDDELTWVASSEGTLKVSSVRAISAMVASVLPHPISCKVLHQQVVLSEVDPMVQFMEGEYTSARSPPRHKVGFSLIDPVTLFLYLTR